MKCHKCHDVLANIGADGRWIHGNGEVRCPMEGVDMMTAHGTRPEDVAVTGVKFDADKPRMDLFSTIWLNGVARVLAFGAKKYAADNWRKGMARRRLIGAALRHITAYNAGEDNDPETGLSHLDHASCCLMFARELHETKPDTDDRYKEIVRGC